MVIEHSEPELEEELCVKRIDGSEERIILRWWTNGEQGKTAVNGGPIRGHARWAGEELRVESWIRVGAREMYFRESWSLSADGQRLNMEHRDGTLADKSEA